MQRAGHSDFETTKICHREAENLSQRFGTVFPALPESLLAIAPGESFFTKQEKNKRFRVAPPGLEPGYPRGPRILNPLRMPIPPRGHD